jgi:hypothetical protein
MLKQIFFYSLIHRKNFHLKKKKKRNFFINNKSIQKKRLNELKFQSNKQH